MEAQLLADKNAKLQLAIDGILSYCCSHNESDSTPLQPELQRIHRAVNLEKNDKLVGQILTGFSNYTYKVFLEKDEYNSSVFVKVALTYALWSPSAKFALDRCSNEKKIMEFFSEKFQNVEDFKMDPPVCKPYFIMDLSQEARMLCNRFEHNQQTWDIQFTHGAIDKRLISKVARILAEVNSLSLDEYRSQFPTDYNDGIKDAYRGVCPTLKAAFQQIVEQPITPQNQHFLDYARKGGAEAFIEAIDNSLVQYEEPDVLLHGDFHAMNILVEDAALSEGDEKLSFGSNGILHMCDWDMSHVGTLGRDLGSLHSFPIVCAYFLAAQGKTEKATSCIDALWCLWKEYARLMTKMSPMISTFDSPCAYLLKLYRSSLGWCGVYCLGANVILKLQMNHFPFDSVSEELGNAVMASYSLTGLKAVEWGFLGNERNPEFTVGELEKWFRETIEEQIGFLAKMSSEAS